jgi:lycopene beta-cyclase
MVTPSRDAATSPLMPRTITCDVAIVGGGLAGGLIAHALASRRPEISVRLIEPGPLGGNHIWCFFSTDVAAADRALIDPFVAKSWNGYDVAFPGHARTLGVQYNAVRSERFAGELQRRLHTGTHLCARALAVGRRAVVLEDGRRIEAKGVIDARGPGDLGLLDLGWQKFVGHELRLERPHGLERPIVMDATVPQTDGYRFVYSLPFAADRVFVEDTYYSDTPELDVAAIEARIADYAEAKGWRVAEIAHREAGVLPVAMKGDFDAYWKSGGAGVAKAGMRAGLFHPTTGYSLPDAVRTAALVAGLHDFSAGALHGALKAFAGKAWAERGFYRLLDTMLFRAAAPDERYRVLERFYRLKPPLIGRFYAATSTPLDRLRILAGKPPVPIGRAMKAILEMRS